ncbi:MAG: RNA polymerase sigma factor [bacterium]|nr:RNA polymerase sigma factor [bacterium]
MNDDRHDRILLAKTAEQDEEAYRDLFQRYYPRVFSFVKRRLGSPELAEEAVADTFFEVWRGAAGFQGKSRVSTWILGIATFKCREAHRSRGRLKRSSVITTPIEHLEAVADEVDPEERMVARNELRWAKHRIDQLPEDQRKVVELTIIEGRSTNEVARRLRVSDGTVKSRLSRARSQLRSHTHSNGKEG